MRRIEEKVLDSKARPGNELSTCRRRGGGRVVVEKKGPGPR